MSVRRAEASDHPAIEAIAREIYNDKRLSEFFNWPEELVRQELAISKSLVFENAEGVHSFICFREGLDSFEIMLLATSPRWQQQQLQRALILYLQELAAKQRKGILLEVHAENTKAKSLYTKMGFKLIHTRQKYYSDGGSALVMSWPDNNGRG
jgi:[ribosomal protein S18]-alanine N-acetyltransferase